MSFYAKCRRCDKKAYAPRSAETVGEVTHALKKKGWAFQNERWTSDMGGYRIEEHWYCPQHAQEIS